MNVISATGVTKTYAAGGVEVHALRVVSVDVASGSFIGFVGPSGSGKTTLLNLVGCLDKPSGGRLEVAGTDVTRLDRRQAAAFRGARIGFVFQSFNLIPRCATTSAPRSSSRPMTRGSSARPRSSTRSSVARLIDMMALFMKAMLIAIVLISVLNVMIMAVYERVREIGTIAAIGTLPRKILSLFLVEGVLLGMAGAAAGVFAGAVVILALNVWKVEPLLAQAPGEIRPEDIEKEIARTVERPCSLGGFLDLQPVVLGLDRDAAFYRLRFLDKDKPDIAAQYDLTLRLEGSLRKGIFSLFARADTRTSHGEFDGESDVEPIEARIKLLEGFGSSKPVPGLAFDAGKKVVK